MQSAMGAERLSGLALLHTYRDRIIGTDPGGVLDISLIKTKNDKFDTLFKTKIPKNIPWLAARPH